LDEIFSSRKSLSDNFPTANDLGGVGEW